MLENLAQYYSNLVLASLVRLEEQPASGAHSVLPASQGRHGAELSSRPERSKREVLLDTAWHVTCWGEGESER